MIGEAGSLYSLFYFYTEYITNETGHRTVQTVNPSLYFCPRKDFVSSQLRTRGSEHSGTLVLHVGVVARRWARDRINNYQISVVDLPNRWWGSGATTLDQAFPLFFSARMNE